MLITRTSQLTGKTHEIDIPVTMDELGNYYQGEQLIQHALPNLTDDQREFIMTGITQEEWNEAFADVEEEEENRRDDNMFLEVDVEEDTFTEEEIDNFDWFYKEDEIDMDEYHRSCTEEDLYTQED